MNQAIIDAAVEVFQLGPEHEDELLRFAMKLQDMEDQERQQEPVKEECATKAIIGNVRERWNELGYNDPERASERFRDDPWRAWYNGWIEGRWPLMTTPKEVRGLSVEQAKDLLRAINAGAWERIDGALRVNAVSQEHVTQCFKDLGIELEPPF